MKKGPGRVLVIMILESPGKFACAVTEAEIFLVDVALGLGGR